MRSRYELSRGLQVPSDSMWPPSRLSHTCLSCNLTTMPLPHRLMLILQDSVLGALLFIIFIILYRSSQTFRVPPFTSLSSHHPREGDWTTRWRGLGSLLFAFSWQSVLVVNLIGLQGAQKIGKNALVRLFGAFPETPVYETAAERVGVTWMWAALWNRLGPEARRGRKGSQLECASFFLPELVFPLLLFTVDMWLLILWFFNLDYPGDSLGRFEAFTLRLGLACPLLCGFLFLDWAAIKILWLYSMQPVVTELSSLQLFRPIW